MILPVTLAILSVAAQEPQLKSIRIFDGGTAEQYMRFVAGTGTIKQAICVYPERMFSGMGPCRVFRYTDGTAKLDPPLASYLKIKGTKYCGFFQPSLLPRPYCHPDGQPRGKEATDDTITYLQEKMTDVKAPGIEGSFRLGNGLSALGYHVKVHPFFDDMWVHIMVTGNWQPNLLDAIAECVGGTIVTEKGPPDTYRIEPNLEEIRARALATLEDYTPSPNSDAFNERETLGYNLIKTASPDLLKRWLDAAKGRDRMSVTDRTWAKGISKYRDMILGELLKQGKAPAGYTMDDFKAMNVFLDLGGYLNFGVTLQAPNGFLIHL